MKLTLRWLNEKQAAIYNSGYRDGHESVPAEDKRGAE